MSEPALSAIGALTVHDDSIISRVAWLVEQRKARINLYRGILRGEKVGDEYYHVNKEAVKQALENEKWLLSDLLEDIEEGLFTSEIRRIFAEYVEKE